MIYRLLTVQFIRSKVALVGLSFLLIAGFSSILIGKSFVNREKSKVEATAIYQQKHIDKTVKFVNKEMGSLLYYLRFAYVNQLNAFTGLSIGQRDVNLGVKQITIRNIEEQNYNSDLNNPIALQMGNLDFSFVLIYLFPLIIIAVCYNLLSEEKEENTWALLTIQSSYPNKILLQKILIRFLFILSVFVLLLILSLIILSLPIDINFFVVFALGLFYIIFWFTLSGCIISLQKSSSVNAIILLSIWLFMTVLAPAIINNIIQYRYPVPEAIQTVVANRDGYHRKWDENKQETIDKFHAHYPEFKKYTLTNDSFSWLWYYSMQQMGDDESAEYSNALKNKLLEREKTSTIIGYFLPTLHTQLQLNNIAKSGLKNQIQFLDSTKAFHERKRLYFYPKIFESFPVLDEDWTKHKVEYFIEKENINVFVILSPLFFINILLFFIILFSNKYRIYNV
jgi:ABC-2 type transport system permease protein